MLETNTMLGQGGSGFQGDGPNSAARMIRELQSLKTQVVAGAAANTNIPIAGIAVTDTIQSVIEHSAAGLPVDRTSVASITSAGNIQLTASSAGNSLVVSWYKKPAAS